MVLSLVVEVYSLVCNLLYSCLHLVPHLLFDLQLTPDVKSDLREEVGLYNSFFSFFLPFLHISTLFLLPNSQLLKLKLNIGIQDFFYSCAVGFSMSHCLWRTSSSHCFWQQVYYWSIAKYLGPILYVIFLIWAFLLRQITIKYTIGNNGLFGRGK